MTFRGLGTKCPCRSRSRRSQRSLAAGVDSDIAAVGGSVVGLRGWPRQYTGGEFGDVAPSAYYAVRDGYAYVADVHGPGDEEPEAFRARKTALCRARALATASYWRDQLQPELTSLFERIDRAAFPSGSTGAGAAWDAAWVAFERVEEIHFDITLGPIQAMNDLAAAYQAAIPGSQVMDADWLIMGRRHELVEVELGVEELTSRVTASPQLGAALASGIRSSEALADLDGGTGFIALLAAFLARHGHLGQSADDLSLASWGEAPASLLTEISRRAIHPPEPVLGRVERQGREAAERADTIRAALVDRPPDL